MNLSKEQLQEIVDLLYYVGIECWGKSGQLLEERADKLKAELKLVLENIE